MSLIGEVEAIEVHDFVPSGDEVFDEFSRGIVAGIDFGNGPELGVGAENQVGATGSPFDGARGAVFSFEEVIALFGFFPFHGQVEEVGEEVIAKDTGLGGEDTEG